MSGPTLKSPSAGLPPAYQADPAPRPTTDTSAQLPARVARTRFQTWYWALVPLLAMAAYAPVLRIGFVSDDLAWLYVARLRGIDLVDPLPVPGSFFYRPVSFVLTWGLGRTLWSTNPLPYHLIGLLLHGATALVLGLWLYSATGRRSLGWLAGALFAVFPLHLEAAGWLSAQWDEWAALFGIASLWLFTLWWRSQRLHLYFLSLACFFLGMFSKESLLAFLPLFAISAWLATERLNSRRWRRLTAVLVPFAGVLVLNLAIRFVGSGGLGNYADVRSDYLNFGWYSFGIYARLLLSPVNSLIFGDTAQQVVAAISGLLVLGGLIWFGRPWRRLLFMALAWIVLAVIPVMSLLPKPQDLEDNRFTYLPAAGYCVLLAALIIPAVAALRRWRWLGVDLVAGLLLLCVVVCWVQLRPWQVATAMASDLEQELVRLIPPTPNPRPHGMFWYVESVPHNYEGAFILRGGLGRMRDYLNGDMPEYARVPDPVEALNNSTGFTDTFALSFALDPQTTRYRVASLAGVTSETQPPGAGEEGSQFTLWDFSECIPGTTSQWSAGSKGAETVCSPGEGIVLTSDSGQRELTSGPLSLQVERAGARFVRVRVAALATPEPGAQSERGQIQLMWNGPSGDWSSQPHLSLRLHPDGARRVYWLYIPARNVGSSIDGLRLDLPGISHSSTVLWVAVDLVK